MSIRHVIVYITFTIMTNLIFKVKEILHSEQFFSVRSTEIKGIQFSTFDLAQLLANAFSHIFSIQ